MTEQIVPKPYTGDDWNTSPENIAHMKRLGHSHVVDTCLNCYRKINRPNTRRHVKACYKENGDMSEAVESLAKKGSTFADRKKLSDILGATGGVSTKYRKDLQDEAFEAETKERIEEILEETPIKNPVQDDWQHSDENLSNLEKARERVGKTLCDCGEWFDNRGYASHRGSGKCPANFNRKVEEVIEPFVEKVDSPVRAGTMYDDMMEVILDYTNITSVEDLNQVEEYIYEGIDMVESMPLQKREVDDNLIG